MHVERIAGIAGVLASLDAREPITGTDARAIGARLTTSATVLREYVADYDELSVRE